MEKNQKTNFKEFWKMFGLGLITGLGIAFVIYGLFLSPSEHIQIIDDEKQVKLDDMFFQKEMTCLNEFCSVQLFKVEQEVACYRGCKIKSAEIGTKNMTGCFNSCQDVYNSGVRNND